jgi:MFS transporter, BCD family, chlorophyll transporter
LTRPRGAVKFADALSPRVEDFSMLIKQLQLGLVHVAVAMTLVPINSTLNRVMIVELGIAATVVAILATLPYFFSPMQVAIGAYSDRHPILGFRRTPYIFAGLILCVAGVMLAPHVAFLIAEDWWTGILAAGLAFGAWGMGYNLASVSYLSLASELSGDKYRGRTIATMWFMMIVGIIFTAILISRFVEPYTPEALIEAVNAVGVVALFLGLLGLFRLEPRHEELKASTENHTLRAMTSAILGNKQARIFFIYLLLLLAAILGQDVLLEPFGAEAFGLTVQQTTRITSIWGVCVLIAILIAAYLERRNVSRKLVAQLGNIGALLGFIFILGSGLIESVALFYSGVVLLGAGTGLSTVANLALMFDLTVPGQVGLFIGAWGVSNALSRMTGTILGGVVRDIATAITQNAILGYAIVFAIEAAFLIIAIYLLTRINIVEFQRKAQAPSVVERAAMAD